MHARTARNELPGQPMIDVHTYKFGGIPHYSYKVHMVERTPNLWILQGDYGRSLVHHT